MALPEITDSNFQAEVVESATPTLVDFWAPWCGPCRMVGPVLEQIDAERDDMRVVKLNVDDNQQTAAKFGVMSIPTMILFKNGQPVQQIVGAQPKPRIESALNDALTRLGRRAHGDPQLAALDGRELRASPAVAVERARSCASVSPAT